MRPHGARQSSHATLPGMASEPNPATKLAHVRPVRPLHFPEAEPPEEHLGQHPRHFDLCALLKVLLEATCGPSHAVSADMFVYWIGNADDDTARRAPDAAVKLDLPAAELREHGSWKTWELGVPELTVEVLSLSDTREKWTLPEKRDAYAAMGVNEFVCFDVDAEHGARLRVWDRIDGDFVERVVEGDRTPCVTLSSALGTEIEWTVAPAGPYPTALRLVREGVLVPSPEEALAAANGRVRGSRRCSRASSRMAIVAPTRVTSSATCDGEKDPRVSDELAIYETQVFQIENDNFRHNVFIKPADLKRADFSDLLFFEACD